MKDKVYIFDLDGTLIDSMPFAMEVVLSPLRKNGIVYPENIVDTLMPLGYKGIAKCYAEEMGVPMTADETYDYFMERLVKAYAEEISLKPTAKETVLALKEGGARVCVLTASPHTFIDPCLKRAGIFDLFEGVWSTEDFGLSKGDVRIYRTVAERLGVGVDALTMIDDCLGVIQAAKRAGAATVAVYEPYSASDEKELRAAADRCVRLLDEILE